MATYRAYVYRVIDGDTFKIDDNKSIRLNNVYAPELNAPGGEAAFNYLKRLIDGRYVNIEHQYNDQFGRSVANVWRASDNLFVNQAMRDYLSS